MAQSRAKKEIKSQTKDKKAPTKGMASLTRILTIFKSKK